MTLEQIQLLKESYMKDDGSGRNTIGAYMRFALDGGIDFVTSKDCVVFDDGNNMLHAVCINEDMKSQANYPVKVISADYGIVQQVEAVFSNKNFESLLESGFLSGVSDEKKEFMRLFAKRIKNHALAPMDPTPYYTTEPKIIPRKTEAMERDDGIKHAVTSSGHISVKTVNSIDSLKAVLENASIGDVVFVDNSVVIDEPLTIDKPVTLLSNGATISSPVTISNDADSVGIVGFNLDITGTFTSASEAKKNASKPLIFASSKSFLLNGCTIRANSYFYNAIRLNCSGDVTIENNIFEGGNKVYNTIEFSQATTDKISSVTIKGNNFKKGSATNNTISIFQFKNGAKVIIENNDWEYAANALRISNYSSSKPVTIVCKNNRYRSVDLGSPDWIGFMLAQGVKNDDFSGITVIFDNLVGPGGKQMTENGIGVDQVWYTYTAKNDPVVIFK